MRRPAGEVPRRPSAQDPTRLQQSQPRPRQAAPQRRTDPRRREQQNRQKIIIACICAITAIFLIGLTIALVMLFRPEEDNGKILSNVYAAGVNIGNKTPEDAKALLLSQTQDTYSVLDMVVQVHDQTVILSPDKTQASLDVDAVINAAYEYGRTGTPGQRKQAKQQSLSSSYHISIVPYLTLNTGYIHSVVEELGETYSSTLVQPEYSISGQQPDLNMDIDKIDVSTVYQTLTLNIGTPEYGLDTDKLYEQIMDAYNMNIFQVDASITVVVPDLLDLNALYQKFCVAPVDAELDTTTYEVTPERYGYGFLLEDLRMMVEEARYGEEISVDLTFLRPRFTAEDLAGDLFKDVLARYTGSAPIDKDQLINLKLACRALDGLILKADESFSFNAILGQPTEAKGFKPVSVYVGKTLREVVGGGVSQAASALYYCALMSDLEITERTGHTYAPSFIAPGLDADVQYGGADLKFVNSTSRPIRINAQVTDNGVLQISIEGTADDEFTVEVVYEKTDLTPNTLTQGMLADNPGNYKNGDILVQPITGCDVATYKLYHYKDAAPGSEPVKRLVSYSHYDKRDKVVVEIQTIPEPPQPPDPSEPAGPTDPTEPSEPVGPSLPDDPSLPAA